MSHKNCARGAAAAWEMCHRPRGGYEGNEESRPGRPGQSHNNSWRSRAAKSFPGSEEPGKLFAFRFAPTPDSQQ